MECSAEERVRHIYAERMSSKPLGWSRRGADQILHLRIYERNAGGYASVQHTLPAD